MFEKHTILADTLYSFAATFDLSVVFVIVTALVIIYRYHNTPYFSNRSISCITANTVIVCICLIPTRVISILLHFDIIDINIDHEQEQSLMLNSSTNWNINHLNKIFEVIKFGIFIPALLNCLLFNTILYSNRLSKISSMLPKTKKGRHVHKQISSTFESPAPTTATTATTARQANLEPIKRGRSRHRTHDRSRDQNDTTNTSASPGSREAAATSTRTLSQSRSRSHDRARSRSKSFSFISIFHPSDPSDPSCEETDVSTANGKHISGCAIGVILFIVWICQVIGFGTVNVYFFNDFTFMVRLFIYCVTNVIYCIGLIVLLTKGSILSFHDAWSIREEFQTIAITVTVFTVALIIVFIVSLILIIAVSSNNSISIWEQVINMDFVMQHLCQIVLDIVAGLFGIVIIFTQTVWVYLVNHDQDEPNDNANSNSNSTTGNKFKCNCSISNTTCSAGYCNCSNWCGNIKLILNPQHGASEFSETESADIDVSALGRVQQRRCNSGSLFGDDEGFGFGDAVPPSVAVGVAGSTLQDHDSVAANVKYKDKSKSKRKVKTVKKTSKSSRATDSTPDPKDGTEFQVTRLWHLFDKRIHDKSGLRLSLLKNEFRGFMDHCLSELCMENILFFVHAVQFLQFLIKYEYFDIQEKKYQRMIKPLKPHFCVGSYVKDTSLIFALKYQHSQVQSILQSQLRFHVSPAASKHSRNVDRYLDTMTSKQSQQSPLEESQQTSQLDANSVFRTVKVNVSTPQTIDETSIATLSRSLTETMLGSSSITIGTIDLYGTHDHDDDGEKDDDAIKESKEKDYHDDKMHVSDKNEDENVNENKNGLNYDIFIDFYCALYRIYIERDRAAMEVNISDELRLQWARNIVVVTNLNKRISLEQIKSVSALVTDRENKDQSTNCTLSGSAININHDTATEFKSTTPFPDHVHSQFVTPKIFEELIWYDIKHTAVETYELLRASFARYLRNKQRMQKKQNPNPSKVTSSN